MKEILDLRTSERAVLRKIPKDLGRDLNAKMKFLPNGRPSPLYYELRQIKIAVDDPLIRTIIPFLRKYDKYVISWVETKRVYTDEEIRASEAFKMSIVKAFEPAGEECGTNYDISDECLYCGTGRKQLGNLKLQSSRLPRRQGWARTIADEWVVSAGIIDLIMRNGFSGIGYNDIVCCRTEESIETWKQPIISDKVHVDPEKTEFGINPFVLDKKGEYACPKGHVSGLNILSELTIEEPKEFYDFNLTYELVGVKRGYLYPAPMIVVTPRVREVFIENDVKGLTFERVHISNTVM